MRLIAKELISSAIITPLTAHQHRIKPVFGPRNMGLIPGCYAATGSLPPPGANDAEEYAQINYAWNDYLCAAFRTFGPVL